MKKVILSAAVIAVFGMTSCSKDYECSCTGTYSIENDPNVSGANVFVEDMPIQQQSTIFEDADEEDAESDCNGIQSQIEGDIESGNIEEYSSNSLSDYGVPEGNEDNYLYEGNINCSVSEAD